MAVFKKAPGSEESLQQGGGLYGLDPEQIGPVVNAIVLYWPTALGLIAVIVLIAKRYPRSIPVAILAAAVLQGIQLQWFW